MIEDAPILTLRENFPRPSAAVLSALKGVPIGYLVDCMNGSGAMDWGIKALPETYRPGATSADPGPVVLGTALPCACGPADNLAVFAAVAIARPGDIIVASTDSHTGCALIGDLLLGMAKNAGVAAVVTDGLARDVPGLLEVGLAIYARGISPNSPARNGPGSVGLPVVVGGVHVAPGDIVAADRDGVVVVPLTEAERVVAKLADVRKAEAGLLAKVKAGLTTPDFIKALLDSPRTKRIG